MSRWHDVRVPVSRTNRYLAATEEMLSKATRAGRVPFAIVLLQPLLASQSGAQPSRPSQIPPSPPTAAAASAIGEYASGKDTLIVFERGQRLFAHRGARDVPLQPSQLERGSSGRAVRVRLGTESFARIAVGTEEGVVFRVTPIRPLDALRREALAAIPPSSDSARAVVDLVELVTLDPGIRLDIRYASINNFLGTPVYSSARAFLQRPAALALVRAHRTLSGYGFGLLIHDAYRPWYVTRMFWDATTGADHAFVADPASGSRHNRGAAVDLTMYDLATGKAVRMPSGYDEFSSRAFAAYPGGSALERWRREVLRMAMEREHFRVNPVEWWHFDFDGWHDYPLINVAFEALGERRPR